jgi:hypothetical protein
MKGMPHLVQFNWRAYDTIIAGKKPLRVTAPLRIPPGWYLDQFPSKKPSIQGVGARAQRNHRSRRQRRHAELKSIRNTNIQEESQLKEAAQGCAIWGQEAQK